MSAYQQIHTCTYPRSEMMYINNLLLYSVQPVEFPWRSRLEMVDQDRIHDEHSSN